MSTSDPNNLGHKVTTREVNWGDLVQRAWGSEFFAPDHGIYEFGNGRKFDSTDKGRTGLYGVTVTPPLEFDLPAWSNYFDLDNSITESDWAQCPLHLDVDQFASSSPTPGVQGIQWVNSLGQRVFWQNNTGGNVPWL
jgi:hypothetical protein